MGTLSNERSVGFSSRDLMLTALFSATYVAYGYLSSVVVGGATHGLDTNLVRSTLFVLLAALTLRFGASTLMGAVCGVVFLLIIPAPFPVYLLVSVLLYGLTYDLYMRLAGFSNHAKKAKHVITATVLASAIMSIVALTFLTWVQVIPAQFLIYAWVGGVLGDIIVGLIGSVVGLRMLRILKYAPTK